MKNSLLFIAILMTFHFMKGQRENEILNLEFRNENVTANYKAFKIGEYYWMSENFNNPKFNTATQEQLTKHMSVWGVPYNVSINDYNKYYGEYYGLGWEPKGKMYENNQLNSGWVLPGIAEFDQLLAMCGTGSYKDIKEYLGAKTNDNPAAVNLESGDIDNGHWFAPNKNVYGFGLMPGGGRINGPWEGLLEGDFYGLYKQARLRLNTGGLIVFDNLTHKVVYEPALYHWLNVRWTKRIPDEVLGYKLYIKDSDFNKYKDSGLIVNFDISTVNIKKLGLQEVPPAGFLELPNGWIRGFYVQKNGTDPALPQIVSHLQIIKKDNKYIFKEKDSIEIYLRTSESNNKNINFGLYNPKDGSFRGPLNIISQGGFIYTCQLPENYIGNFMLVPYIVQQNGEKNIVKRAPSSPWIDRLPLTIQYKINTKKYIPSEAFQVTSYMQLNIKENGSNMVNKIFQVDIEKNFMVSMPTSNQEISKIGLFYSNGDFYTNITTSRKGAVYTCKIPNTVQDGTYVIMPYTKENKEIKVIERTNDKYYMDRLPLVVLEEDIWGEDSSLASLSQKNKENLIPYVKDNNLYIKGLIYPATISIYNLNGNKLKSQKNITQDTGTAIYNLKTGVYIIQLISEQGKVKNLKFIKE